MELPLSIPASEAKIHGRVLKYQQKGEMIVSWNQTPDYIEWTVPAHIKKGEYEVVLNYSCDKNRQGSEMEFSNGETTVQFKTKGKSKKWSPDKLSIGKMTLQPGQKLTLKCKKLKADWVLDFHDLEFVKK